MKNKKNKKDDVKRTIRFKKRKRMTKKTDWKDICPTFLKNGDFFFYFITSDTFKGFFSFHFAEKVSTLK